MKPLGLEFKVGLFTLLGLVATGYLFFVLSPRSFDSKNTMNYYTVLKDASGIMPKTHVKTNGVSVGKVKDVQLEVDHTKVIIEVDAEVRIPQGSTIDVRTVGLLGDKFIEITRAPDTGVYLKDGDLIPRSTDSTDMTELLSTAGSIAKDIKRITGTLANVLGEEDGEQRVRNIVANIESIAENAKGILADNRADIRRLVGNLEQASHNVRELLDDDNREKIDRIIASFDQAMEDVKSATHNIRTVSDKVERGEGTLGRLINDDKALAELEGAIKDIRDVISPANKLQIAVDYHGEVRKDETTQNYFNMLFKTRPDRFYLVGFTEHDYERVETTTTTEAVDATSTRTTELKDSDAKLRFNLQFGKRWYFVALRFGLFESTGGFASDFYLFRDRFRLSLEAFDFRSKDNPIRRVAHLKAYASILFFNHLYAMVGVDDPTRTDRLTGKQQKVPNYFFGAGLTFNDDDIKAIFGAAALAR